MAIRQVSFASPQQVQSPLVQALAPRDPRTMLAIQALQEGSSTAPVHSIGAGLARVAQGALGGFMAGQERRKAEETGMRLADSILATMPEVQRNSPQGQMLAAALRDPDTRNAVLPGVLQSSLATPTEEETVRGQPNGFPGMVQRNRQTGQIQPLDTPERAAAMRAATEEPYVVIGENVFPRAALRQRFGTPGQPGQPGQTAADYPVEAQTAALAQLRQGESGGNPTAVSRDRNGQPIAHGLYQFTPATWADAIAADPALAGRFSPADMYNERAQEAVAQSHARNIMTRLGRFVGQPFNGQPITPEQLIRAAWLGGIRGAERYIESNGQYNPPDVYGTRIGDYFSGTAPNLQPIQARTQVAQSPAQIATDARPSGPQPAPGSPPTGPRAAMGTVDGMPVLNSPRSPSTAVTIDQRAGQAMIELDRDRLKAMQEASGNDRRMLATFDRMERALRAVPEGAGAQWLPAFGQAARALGLEINGTSEAEVAQAIQAQLTGLARVPGSGATSDFEQRLYMQSVPRLGNTREGNMQLIDMGRRLIRRRIEEMNIARRIMRRDGNLDRLDDEIDALGPVFGERDLQVLQGGGAAAPAAPGATPGAAPAAPPPRQRFRNDRGDVIEWDGTAWVPVQPAGPGR